MKTAIALGTFDGLHSGHIAVLEKVLDMYSVAVSFSKPPKFHESSHSMIMSEERKYRCLKDLGVKKAEFLNFADVKNLSPEEFLDSLVKKYNPALISCGFNYRFGKNAAGDTAFLKDYCDSHSIELNVCECVRENGEVISSSRIRTLLENGEIETANRMIYGGFCFSGEVLHGDSRGHTLGFPTANQQYPKELVTVKFGVYKSNIEIDGKIYKGISNIGLRPTFLTEEPTSETFIKDFSGDIYGKNITVYPTAFIRGEQKFSNINQLKSAVLRDIDMI